MDISLQWSYTDQAYVALSPLLSLEDITTLLSSEVLCTLNPVISRETKQNAYLLVGTPREWRTVTRIMAVPPMTCSFILCHFHYL